MRIHYFQHVPFEGLGMIAEWTKKSGHTLTKTFFHEPSPVLPAISDYDALIIMGGPMSVYDEDKHHWLVHEKRHIRAAIDAGKLILGVCLGAQLIATALGAKVAPHRQKEIGWFPVAVNSAAAGQTILVGLNTPMTVFHWHGDRFEIPAGSIHLMSNVACDNQAFLYNNRVLGLQFHLEMDEKAISMIIDACFNDLEKGDYIQTANVILDKAKTENTNQLLHILLDNWASQHKLPA